MSLYGKSLYTCLTQFVKSVHEQIDFIAVKHTTIPATAHSANKKGVKLQSQSPK